MEKFYKVYITESGREIAYCHYLENAYDIAKSLFVSVWLKCETFQDTKWFIEQHGFAEVGLITIQELLFSDQRKDLI